MTDMQWIEGGITAVPGILAAGITAGIKPSGKKDLALIYSSAPARAAAVFTTNQVKGAPVLVSQEHIRDGKAQAIVASSGCSNVCTGEQGVKDAREMTKTVGELLRIKPSQVLIAATGVIGQPLPMDKIRTALPKLVKALSPQGGRSAAEAIMTTDTRLKEAALRVEVGGRPITIGGIAKGVGMLEPHLATMFCFLATDAMVAADALPRVLKRSADASINRITVDGDQSTSDTVAVLANGLAENAPRTRSPYASATSRWWRKACSSRGPAWTRSAPSWRRVSIRSPSISAWDAGATWSGHRISARSTFESTPSTRPSNRAVHYARSQASVPRPWLGEERRRRDVGAPPLAIGGQPNRRATWRH